jgi:hypothetical protein
MPRILARFRAVTLVVALLSAGNIVSAAEAHPLQARKWDQPMTIPSGAWRGVQSVKSLKDKKHRIEAGALVEGAEIDAEGGVQWQVDGAVLRDCHFSGDLGFRFDAKDTAFEGCKLHKSGGWFVGWAGTRWHLTNCLITRSFLPKDIGLHDYSVRASDCTFVGVEMPEMSHKKDPSTYSGKDDVKFEHCRFVGCDITESVLAASVNCLFESCRFHLDFEKKPGKPDKWETAKAAVNVSAYLVNEEPHSNHVHGQLNVAFFKAEPGATAGCTLPIGRAGTRVVLPGWARQITAWGEIGSLEKAASDIPAPAAVPAPSSASALSKPAEPVPPVPVPRKTISGASAFLNLPSSPAKAPASTPVVAIPPRTPAAASNPLPSASAPPRPAPSDAPLRKVDELLSAVPRGANFVTNGKLTTDGTRQLIALLEDAAVGRPAAIRITVEQSRPFMEEGYELLVTTSAVPIRVQGCNINARIEAKFRGNQLAQKPKLTKGTALNLRGTVGKVSFATASMVPEMVVTLEEASLE